MTEEELERAIASAPDSPIPNLDWANARLVMPERKESVHLRIDPDVLAWFRRGGKGYLTRSTPLLHGRTPATMRSE
jgi:uncharacterized protein (DUF4415 family)